MICCRNLCLKLKSRVHLPRGSTVTTGTDKLQCRDLPCYTGSHSELTSTQLKRSPLDSSYPAHSFTHYYGTPTFFSKHSVDRARSKFVLCRTVGAVVPHFTHSYCTNSTSVRPPPTPSTQGHCLPSSESDSHSDNIQIPEPPTNCCMSGCANCVWITYAQELAELYKDSGRAADSVMNAIDDPSLKMFLNLELKEKLNSEE